MYIPPEYAAENNSAPLFETCISFLVLETFFICLLWIAWYMTRENKTNISVNVLMTTGYISCVGKITLGICAPTPSPSMTSILIVLSDGQNRWRRTPPFDTRSSQHKEHVEAADSLANHMPVHDVSNQTRHPVTAPPDHGPNIQIQPPRNQSHFRHFRPHPHRPTHYSLRKL